METVNFSLDDNHPFDFCGVFELKRISVVFYIVVLTVILSIFYCHTKTRQIDKTKVVII